MRQPFDSSDIDPLAVQIAGAGFSLIALILVIVSLLVIVVALTE